MKQLTIFVLILALALGLFVGCRSRREDPMTTTGTTPVTTLPRPSNTLPDTSSTIDPTNGASQDGTPDTVDPNAGANEDMDMIEDMPEQITGDNARGRGRHIR